MAMNKFRKAFDGKRYELLKNWEVSRGLLYLLHDRKVLADEHLEPLREMKTNGEKVEKLLEVLVLRDDSLFDVFCSVLEANDQFSIVKIIQPEAQRTLPMSDESRHITRLDSVCVSQERLALTKGSERDRIIAELEEILEVDYGLPNALYKNEVLTLSQWQDIAQHCHDHRFKVQQRVSCLVNFAVEKLKKRNQNVLSSLKSTPFLMSLYQTHQPHLVNFIEVGGVMESISDDAVCPLNEHQRRSLHPCLGSTEETCLNARNPTLQDLLLGEKVISRTQQEYLTTGAPCSTTCNERLLLIMVRRSVADVKRFFRCLVKVGQGDVVDKLNVPGIYVCIHTTIHVQTMTNEAKQKREGRFVKFFNRLRRKGQKSDRHKELGEACARLEEKDCVCKGVHLEQSIAWFIHCQTMRSLLNLREMYNSNELAHVLHDIFNAIRDGHKPLPLRVEWGAEDYEFCRAVFEKPSIRPFGTLSYDDELLRKTGVSTLDAVHLGVLEVILLKAYKILYNSLRMAPHESIDVLTRGVMPPFAAQIALPSVCFKWWKVIIRSDWERRKELLMISNVFNVQTKEEDLKMNQRFKSRSDFKAKTEHCETILKNYQLLVDKMDLKHSGALGTLLSLQVIDLHEMDAIKSERTHIGMNKKLLDLLSRKSFESFQKFLQALNETGQRHLVDSINEHSDESSGSSQVLRLQQATARLRLTADKSSGAVVQRLPTSQVQQTTAKRNAVSHVISSDGRGAVVGVAIYSDKLFVLRERSKERIQQFDVKTFQEEEFIKVNGLRDDGGWWYKSMTSCDINSCLYINDEYKVFRVNPSTKDVISWPVDGCPIGLSVNETRNVLVTCWWDDTIKEYLTDGSFVRSIKLQVNHVMRPLHCIQLTDSRYVVCHERPVDGVSEIDKHGTLIATYRNSKTTELEMNEPRCVILFNDSLLVADMRNDRILLLNTSSRDARPLSLPVNSQLSQPLCMYLEQSRGRLFVGEVSGRVLVIDNIDLK